VSTNTQCMTEIGARLTFGVNAHTDSRRTRVRLYVGRVLVFNTPPAKGPAEEAHSAQKAAGQKCH